jgi:prephenate dehydrogenase
MIPMGDGPASFDTVAIVGPGLIGASMGIALRQRGLAGRIVGIGRRQTSLDKALQVRAIHESTLSVAEGVGEAELIVLATPIGSFSHLAPQIAAAAPAGAILTDVASSKSRVIETVAGALADRPDVAYVPTHPMAGGEQSGPLAASGGLFEDAICIITPFAEPTGSPEERIRQMWEALGARVVTMPAEEHDRTVARISHVPHLAASALIAFLHETDMEFCGRGLVDTTRVASGSPDMWVDICGSNALEITQALVEFIQVLEEVRSRIENGDHVGLRATLAAAKEKRDRLLGLRAPGPGAERQ